VLHIFFNFRLLMGQQVGCGCTSSPPLELNSLLSGANKGNSDGLYERSDKMSSLDEGKGGTPVPLAFKKEAGSVGDLLGRKNLKNVRLKRRKEDLISLVFKSKPLGIALTSAHDGTQAYVTETEPDTNPVVKVRRLKYSKLLKVNDKDVEDDPINDIKEAIVEATKKLPMVLTFCVRNGLMRWEVPDQRKTQTKRSNIGMGRRIRVGDLVQIDGALSTVVFIDYKSTPPKIRVRKVGTNKEVRTTYSNIKLIKNRSLKGHRAR